MHVVVINFCICILNAYLMWLFVQLTKEKLRNIYKTSYVSKIMWFAIVSTVIVGVGVGQAGQATA